MFSNYSLNDCIKDAVVLIGKHTNTYTIGEEWNNFLIEVELIYNIVLVSGVQHNDSVIHIYVYTYVLFLILFHCSVLQAIESVLYSKSLLFINFTLILPIYPSPPSPLVTINLFSMSVGLFLFCK